MGQIIIIDRARLSYPMLDVPKDYKGNKKFRRGANFWLPKTVEVKGKQVANPMVAAVVETIRNVAKEAWPSKPSWETVLPEVLLDKKGCCWIDGSRRSEDNAEDYWTLASYLPADKGRPLVFDSDMSPIYKDDDTYHPGKAGKLYAGCWVKGKVEIWAQKGDNGNAIRAKLLVVQRIGDGDSFGGGAAPDAEGFGEVSEGADADDMSA